MSDDKNDTGYDDMVCVARGQWNRLWDDSNELRWYKEQMPIALDQLDELRKTLRETNARVLKVMDAAVEATYPTTKVGGTLTLDPVVCGVCGK